MSNNVIPRYLRLTERFSPGTLRDIGMTVDIIVIALSTYLLAEALAYIYAASQPVHFLFDFLNNFRIFLVNVLITAINLLVVLMGLDVISLIQLETNTVWTRQSLNLILLLIFMTLYYVLTESSNMEGTLGKFITGRRVVSVTGRKLTRWHALYRHFMRVSFVVLSPLLLVIRFAYARGRWKHMKYTRAWHDFCSRTVVVPRLEQQKPNQASQGNQPSQPNSNNINLPNRNARL